MRTQLPKEQGWYESGDFLWFFNGRKITDAISIESGSQHSYCEDCFTDEIAEANWQLQGSMIFNEFALVDNQRVKEVCGLG